MSTISKIHVDLFAKKNTILFCGAGISMNSGIPSVQPLLEYILKRMGARHDHVRSFLNSGYPFEAIMENLNDRFDIKKLLKIFRVKNPNLNHDIISKLAVHGFLKLIITTNFDSNIEIALVKNGLKENRDFKVITDLRNLDLTVMKNYITVLKLHGTIKSLPSILTTLKRIARKENTLSMEHLMKDILSLPGYKNILYWGYSFSDHFDIKPAVIKMPKSRQKAFVLNYLAKSTPEHIHDISLDEPYRKFAEATRMDGNLENIVNELYLFKGFQKPREAKLDRSWKHSVREWVSSETGLGLRDKRSFLGNVFLAAGFVEFGRYYAELNLPKINTTRNGKLIAMDIAAIIGKSHLKDPNNRQVALATKHFTNAFNLAYELKLETYINLYTGNLGSCYLMAKDYVNAEGLYTNAINYYSLDLHIKSKSANAYDRFTGYSIMLGHTYTRMGNYPKAFRIYKKTLALCEEMGLPSNKELCIAGHGFAHLYNKDYPAGLRYFMKAYPLTKENGSIDRIKSIFFMVCSWTREVKGKAKAREFYEKEIVYIKNKTGFDKPLFDIPTRLFGTYTG